MENKIFDEMYKVENQHWWFVARRKIIESAIRQQNLAQNSVIFDAGCGNGDNLAFLSRHGAVQAMERDERALSKAKEREIGEIFQGELPNAIPSEIRKDNDLIVLLDVLEHIDDDGGSLAALSHYIDDKGRLIMTVPAYQFLWTIHDELHHHKRRYTVGSLRKVIENNGWNISYISYFNCFLFPLALIDRMKQKIFSTNENGDLKMPPKLINVLFEKIFALESRFIGKIKFPFGLSILVVAEKNNNGK